MRFPATLALALWFTFGLSACGGSSSEAPEETPAMADADASGVCPHARLVGSWELVSVAEDAPALTGQYDTDPDYQVAPTLKVLNDTHWMFIRQSSDQFIHAQGGRYMLESGGFYTEVVDYSALPGNVGKSFEFTCELEGDSLWHHVGGLGDTRYREVWRRVR